MELAVIKPIPSQLVVLNDGGVIHFQAKRGLILCFFMEKGLCGGGVFIDGVDAATAEPSIKAAIKDLLSRLAPSDTARCRVKLVGVVGAIQFAKDLLGRHAIRVESECSSDAEAIEVFFHTDTGRLRLREVQAAKGVDNATLPQPRKKRVLIVDDSRTIRQLLSAIVTKDPELEVVGVAERPSQVEELIKTLKPDVMTLDINMPEMDGVTLIEKLLPKYPIPTVMITALSMEDGNQVLRALELGAVDYIQKPSLEQMQDVEAKIREKIKVAATATVRSRPLARTKARTSLIPTPHLRRGAMPIIAIGASTGGTDAIRQLLVALPEHIPPIVIVQHIPAVFSAAFAKRLNELCPFEVCEAKDGDEVRAGRVLVAPGGLQMVVVKKAGSLQVEVKDGATVSGHKPSVDVLFHSVVECSGAFAIGALLTGMGGDGAKGLLAMRQAGARTIAQDEASCVVYGMPAVAVKMGAVEVILPLDRIAEQIEEWTTNLMSKHARRVG